MADGPAFLFFFVPGLILLVGECQGIQLHSQQMLSSHLNTVSHYRMEILMVESSLVIKKIMSVNVWDPVVCQANISVDKFLRD